MGFVITRISNHGTQHPIVARLMVQTHDLLPWADLPKDQQDKVAVLYHELADRLLKCDDAYKRLSVALDAATREHQPSSDGRIKYVPHVIGLKAETETFLYEAKNFLRDLLRIINIFFATNFEEANVFYDAGSKGDGKLVEWAKQTFGAADPFTTMLIAEQDWIAELIRKRNAVEHPGKKSGTLHVQNIEPTKDARFVLPTWHRDQNQPTSLFQDLETYLGNLLTLAEDVLVSCIVHKGKHKTLRFVEIPEAERDPKCPKRITVTFNHATVKPSA